MKMSNKPNGDELILKEYQSSCLALKTQKIKMLKIRQNLIVLNERNETTSRSLSNTKSECDFYKSHLSKTLFNMQISSEKQKILFKMKLKEFSERKNRTEEYLKVSPINSELEELLRRNGKLQEECKKKADLLKFTTYQYKDLMSEILEKFKNKICEFCQAVLEYNSVKLKVKSWKQLEKK